jgi:hypothetical protein
LTHILRMGNYLAKGCFHVTLEMHPRKHWNSMNTSAPWFLGVPLIIGLPCSPKMMPARKNRVAILCTLCHRSPIGREKLRVAPLYQSTGSGKRISVSKQIARIDKPSMVAILVVLFTSKQSFQFI